LFLFCRLVGCWLAPGGGKFLLSRVLRVVARFFRWETAAHTSCVVCGVLGVDETRIFCGLSALVGCKGFCRVTSVFVFWF